MLQFVTRFYGKQSYETMGEYISRLVFVIKGESRRQCEYRIMVILKVFPNYREAILEKCPFLNDTGSSSKGKVMTVTVKKSRKGRRKTVVVKTKPSFLTFVLFYNKN